MLHLTASTAVSASDDSVPAVLLFLPGFMSSAQSYRALLEPVAAGGTDVTVPQLYARGPAAMLGRISVVAEAELSVEALIQLAAQSPGSKIFLGGHSRGGQAAWRAANLLAAQRETVGLLSGLVLIDPVDGAGRNPTVPTATATTSEFNVPTLIIGAGIGGACAPEPVNHMVFAAATPHARHVVVRQMGHADMLDDRARAFGRKLCGGAAEPDQGRMLASSLVRAFVKDPMVFAGSVIAGSAVAELAVAELDSAVTSPDGALVWLR